MLLLLPPSETKRDGGEGGALDLTGLSFPSLTPVRRRLVADVSALAADPAAMMRALRLGPRQSAEVARNAAIRSSPRMPALDRYTGVLYDALDAPSLDAASREFAASRVAVHSALFGLLGAMDEIPAYRLSHDSRVGPERLRARWRAPIERVLAERGGLIVDLRSEGYAELGPAPARPDSVFVRVVAEDGAGRRRALNHFNKRAKGLFTRALLEHRPQLETTGDLLAWADSAGFRLDAAGAQPHELELVA
ncbi:peroxide stress protein YaaA [Agromyces sp. CFH 90414]|uniref:Peroxide stress protein YaaA n=1 Tax=Agromyces agglutinans TaxID=2662258 RepID=A0A6I2FLE9_9MICO|nr:peroxide stress protein YaaA [Agromyces agglutinans]MRG61458.1 peroxide stress protein YaaA [Agromyces agglutinans]